MAQVPDTALPFSNDATNGNIVTSDVWNQVMQIFQIAINDNDTRLAAVIAAVALQIVTSQIADGAVTTNKIFDGSIETAKIAAGAVTSAKIASGAVASANILDGTILDVDVNSAAAIAWSKISKVASSLADLATRSASDLNSGTLSTARLPSGIDVAKLADGSISNAIFQYLSGLSSNAQNQLDAKIPLTQKGAANGVAPLDSGAKLDASYLPASIVGQMEYIGTWNASTNTPTLPDPTTVKGNYYIVNTAGTYLTVDYAVKDWIVSNGVDWEKVDNTDAVTSVFGRLGAIAAMTNDYTWAQIDKTISSLADLATRSASDLNSGILPDGRMPNLTGDITTVEGSVATTITDGAVTTNKIAAGAITSDRIADGVITASQLADGAVNTAQLADGAVTANKIEPGLAADITLNTHRLADPIDHPDGSVTTAKLADGSVTAAKVASDVALQADLIAHEQDYTEHVPYGGVTTGTANTYALATPAISALTAGMAISVKFNIDSTAASTLDWNGQGAKGIKKANGTDVTNLKATGIYTLRYDGTNFILQGEGGGGTAAAGDILSGKTATVDSGDITGTMPNNGALGTITPTTSNQSIPAGYTAGGTVAGDADLISANIKSGANIFGVAGSSTVVDTSAGDATASQILSGKKAYVDGALVTGNIPIRTASQIVPSTTQQNLPDGYYDGAHEPFVAAEPNLIAANILSGKSIFGVAGSSTVVDTSAGDATAGDIASGKIAFSDGVQITGTLKRWASGSGTSDSSGNIDVEGIGFTVHTAQIYWYNDGIYSMYPVQYTVNTSGVTNALSSSWSVGTYIRLTPNGYANRPFRWFAAEMDWR